VKSARALLTFRRAAEEYQGGANPGGGSIMHIQKKATVLLLSVFLCGCVSISLPQGQPTSTTSMTIERIPTPTHQPTAQPTDSPTPLSTKPVLPTPSLPADGSVTLTYSGDDGGIYQVTLSGKKSCLLPADGIGKDGLWWSPDRAHLAYVTREWNPDLTESLWMIDATGGSPQRLFGPAKSLRYSWKGGSSIYVEEAVSFRHLPFDEGTVIQVYMIDLPSAEVRPVGEPTDAHIMPDFSPDGRWAAAPERTGANSWVLSLLDRQGNQLRVIYRPPAGYAATGVWSPDSQRLAIFRPEDQAIYSYDVDSSTWHKLVSLPRGSLALSPLAGEMRWSPDGEWLSYTTQEAGNSICVLRVEDGLKHCFKVVNATSNWYVWGGSSQIAYVSRDSVQGPDLFATSVPGGVMTNLTQDGNSIVEDSIAP
jgi:Tol biopolymer transport system component